MHKFHTPIFFIHIFMIPYSNFIVPYNYSYFHTTQDIYPYPHSFHINIPSSLPVIFFFLLFFFSFLFFFFFFFRFCSLFFQDQNEIFILVLSLFDLIPFLFHFPRRKLPPSFLQATCLFHNFSSLFYSNIFLLLPFGPHFHFYSQFNLSKSYFGI